MLQFGVYETLNWNDGGGGKPKARIWILRLRYASADRPTTVPLCESRSQAESKSGTFGNDKVFLCLLSPHVFGGDPRLPRLN